MRKKKFLIYKNKRRRIKEINRKRVANRYKNIIFLINSLASPSAGAPALKYGDVNTVTPSPGEVKGLVNKE